MNEQRTLGIIKKIIELGFAVELRPTGSTKQVLCRVHFLGKTVFQETGHTPEDALQKVNGDLDQCWKNDRSNKCKNNKFPTKYLKKIQNMPIFSRLRRNA